METLTTSLLSKQEKLQQLNASLNEAKEITTITKDAPIFVAWKVQTEIILAKIFGQSSIELIEFKKLNFFSPDFSFNIVNRDAVQHVVPFRNDFETAKKLIAQLIENIQQEREGNIPTFLNTTATNTVNKSLPKIEWLGTQKQLGELFIELKGKGWIKDINTDLIQNYFSKSETIKQVLKPSNDKLGNANYDGVFTKAYKPKFDLMRSKEKDK